MIIVFYGNYTLFFVKWYLFDKDYNLIYGKEIVGEFKNGAFAIYRNEDYYYILYTRSNPEKNDDAEVYRIVKYSSSLEKIASASVYGGESKTVSSPVTGQMPSHGNITADMVEKDANLIVHTSRSRYDGHQ